MSRSATSPDLIPMRVEVYHNNIAHARIVLGTWLGFHGPSHHLGGCPHGCGTVRDGLQNDRSCTDLGTIANGYVSKDGRACTYQNVSADLGMSILTLALARTTESNAVQQGATIPNNGRFTDNNSGGMVQHYGPADRGRGVDINAKGRRCLTLQPEGNEARHFARHARCLAPSSSRGTMQNECSESFKEKQRLQDRQARRITIDARQYVLSDRFGHGPAQNSFVGIQRVVNNRPHGLGADIWRGPAQTSQTMSNRRGDGLIEVGNFRIEDRAMEEARYGRFRLGGLEGLGAETFVERIGDSRWRRRGGRFLLLRRYR
mmetsp:Transcript_36910/g.80793  ORF Transcript_36910/g.80793 Transcript_36910/m.80793 type:complete len:317 (-) Transcript_36910:225-1175(-)